MYAWVDIHTVGAEQMFVEWLSIDQQHLLRELSPDMPPSIQRFKWPAHTTESSLHNTPLI